MGRPSLDGLPTRPSITTCARRETRGRPERSSYPPLDFIFFAILKRPEIRDAITHSTQ
jgi:hypothetical protein